MISWGLRRSPTMLKSDPSLVIDDVERSFGDDLLSSGDFGADSCVEMSSWGDSLKDIRGDRNSIFSSSFARVRFNRMFQSINLHYHAICVCGWWWWYHEIFMLKAMMWTWCVWARLTEKKLMTTIALAEFIRKRSIINRMHEAQFNLTLIYSDIRFSQAWNWMKTFLFLFTSKISYKFHLFEDVFIPMLFDSMLPVRNNCSSESDRWELFRRTWHFTFTFQLPLGAVKETRVEFLMIWESWKSERESWAGENPVKHVYRIFRGENVISVFTYITLRPSKKVCVSLQSSSARHLKHSRNVHSGTGAEPPSGSSVKSSQSMLIVSMKLYGDETGFVLLRWERVNEKKMYIERKRKQRDRNEKKKMLNWIEIGKVSGKTNLIKRSDHHRD